MANTDFVPTAMFFDDSDCVEYLREDTFCVYDRVDEFLTLVYDETKINLIGFKLKGFKYFFREHLQGLYKLNGLQYLDLEDVIESVCNVIGDKLFADEARERAYMAVRKIAANDNAKILSSDLKLAA